MLVMKSHFKTTGNRSKALLQMLVQNPVRGDFPRQSCAVGHGLNVFSPASA